MINILSSLFTGIILTALCSGIALAQNAPSDEQIRQAIIDQSIAAYPGRCACPYNQAKNGSACGKRSAWNKAGGYAPICYRDEVTQAMIAAWKANQARNG
ncbi:hypothetical protein ACVQK1_01125 [Edwardsiella tarda]